MLTATGSKRGKQMQSKQQIAEMLEAYTKNVARVLVHPETSEELIHKTVQDYLNTAMTAALMIAAIDWATCDGCQEDYDLSELRSHSEVGEFCESCCESIQEGAGYVR
jgi:hypothetical protein